MAGAQQLILVPRWDPDVAEERDRSVPHTHQIDLDPADHIAQARRGAVNTVRRGEHWITGRPRDERVRRTTGSLAEGDHLRLASRAEVIVHDRQEDPDVDA